VLFPFDAANIKQRVFKNKTFERFFLEKNEIELIFYHNQLIYNNLNNF